MIKIEVTGHSLVEVSDKLLAIGASLQRTVSYDGDNAAREALQAQRDAAKQEVAEEAPVDPTSTPTAPAVEEQASSPSSAVPTDAPAAPTAELDFDTDIAPLVLQVVKDKGKPVAQEILSQFGVEKASNLDPARWPELVAALQDAL